MMKISSSYEVDIVWEDDVNALPYVREFVEEFAPDRQRPVRWSGEGRRVGYSVLAKDAPHHPGTGGFLRRVFWVSPDDPYPAWPWVPVEAVDPRTVRPNAVSANLMPSDFEQNASRRRLVREYRNQKEQGN